MDVTERERVSGRFTQAALMCDECGVISCRPGQTTCIDCDPTARGGSGFCDLGERLVEKSLTTGANGRLIEHLDGCRQCAAAVAS